MGGVDRLDEWSCPRWRNKGRAGTSSPRHSCQPQSVRGNASVRIGRLNLNPALPVSPPSAPAQPHTEPDSHSDGTCDAVWQDFCSGNIDAVAHTLGTSTEQALQQVANKLIKHSDNLLEIWRFSFEVLTFAFFALLVLVFVFVARQSFPHGKSDQVVLTLAGGIPKFHVITDKDIVKKNVKTIDGSLSDVLKVWGHYAMEPISTGENIQSSQLSSGSKSDNGQPVPL